VASVFREQEEDFGEEHRVTRSGFQFQESVEVSPRTTILFGYRFARTRVTSPLLAFPSTQGVASLKLSGIRDSRDDVLDARTGRFLSLNLTLAPALIGSDQNFVKGLAQAFLSFPVGRRMTWAQGYRLGLAHVFGGEPLISTEGFRAGGPNTVRVSRPMPSRGASSELKGLSS
jgi:outer membrane protein assembly factor BamA